MHHFADRPDFPGASDAGHLLECFLKLFGDHLEPAITLPWHGGGGNRRQRVLSVHQDECRRKVRMASGRATAGFVFKFREDFLELFPGWRVGPSCDEQGIGGIDPDGSGELFFSEEAGEALGGFVAESLTKGFRENHHDGGLPGGIRRSGSGEALPDLFCPRRAVRLANGLAGHRQQQGGDIAEIGVQVWRGACFGQWDLGEFGAQFVPLLINRRRAGRALAKGDDGKAGPRFRTDFLDAFQFADLLLKRFGDQLLDPQRGGAGEDRHHPGNPRRQHRVLLLRKVVIGDDAPDEHRNQGHPPDSAVFHKITCQSACSGMGRLSCQLHPGGEGMGLRQCIRRWPWPVEHSGPRAGGGPAAG